MKRARLCKLVSMCIPLSKINFEEKNRKYKCSFRGVGHFVHSFYLFVYYTIFLEIDGNSIRLNDWISQRRDLFSILSSNRYNRSLSISHDNPISVRCFRFADKLIRSCPFFHHRIISTSSLFFYQFNNLFICNHS